MDHKANVLYPILQTLFSYFHHTRMQNFAACHSMIMCQHMQDFNVIYYINLLVKALIDIMIKAQLFDNKDHEFESSCDLCPCLDIYDTMMFYFIP